MKGPIAVVGASLAGLNAAQELRRRGYAGRLTIFGDELHRPYDRPPLSKEWLRGEWPRQRLDLACDDAALDARWRLGASVAALDAASRTLTLADGSTHAFEGLVIATGARPRALPGERRAGVHVVRSLEDIAGLRADLHDADALAVIGAGFIGQEAAASARKLGLDVTLIEAAAPARHVVGAEIADRIAAMHRAHGVDVRLGVSVAALEGDRRLEAVRLGDGGCVPARVAIVGIGVTPNIEWLEGSGLTIDDGLLCDETCLAAPGIVAAGDVARWPNRRYGELRRVEHWDNAVRMGAHAARRLLAEPGSAEERAPFTPVPWFWSDQYGCKMQLVGSAYAHDEVRIVEEGEGRLLALFRRGDRLTAAFAIGMTRRLLGLRRLLEGDPRWDEGLAAA